MTALMCTIVVSLTLQVSSDRPAVAKQYSYVSIAKAEAFATYYREQIDKEGPPPRILDVQMVRTLTEFNCANFIKGEE